MAQSPSWASDNPSASQEIPCLLWNPKVHYRVHNSQTLKPILGQINSVHTTTPILILSSNLRLGFPSRLFPFGFQTKILHTYINSHACCMSRPSYNLIILARDGKIKIVKWMKHSANFIRHYLLRKCNFDLLLVFPNRLFELRQFSMNLLATIFILWFWWRQVYLT
jgi:hypothetical protein